VFDDTHRMGEQAAREQQEVARKIREDAVKERMQRWEIGREPAEYILDLELQVQEFVKTVDG
jgi:adenosine deaminase